MMSPSHLYCQACQLADHPCGQETQVSPECMCKVNIQQGCGTVPTGPPPTHNTRAWEEETVSTHAVSRVEHRLKREVPSRQVLQNCCLAPSPSVTHTFFCSCCQLMLTPSLSSPARDRHCPRKTNPPIYDQGVEEGGAKEEFTFVFLFFRIFPPVII